MTKEDLIKYKKKINALSNDEVAKRNLYLKGLHTGKYEGPMIGLATIDRPWLKYYSDEAIDTEIPTVSAYQYLLNCNKNNMNKYALNYFGRKFTFKELIENIAKTEKALRKLGVEKGDIVSVSLPNMPEAVYLYYALSKMGAIANMIDPRTSIDGFKEYLEEVDSKLLIVIDILKERLDRIVKGTKTEKIVIVSPSDSLPLGLKLGYKAKKFIENNKSKMQTKCSTIKWNEFLNVGKDYQIFDDEEYVSNTPSLIVHTGGTTGIPKGVLLSNENINAVAFQSMNFPTDLQSNHRWLDIMPPFIAYGIGSGLHFPLCNGMETVLIPQFDPKELDKLVLKYKPNHIAGAPTHWNYFIKSKRLKNKDLSYLITCAVGGDALNIEVEKKANEFLKEHGVNRTIVKGYGMTETNGSIGRTVEECNELGSVGVPFAQSIVGIFDPETDNEMPYGEKGEICMSGPNVMLEYFNNPEQTNIVKKTHEDGTTWIHSGDIGYMNENGNIFVVNRIKRLIIRHDGFKIFPSNIEKIIQSHPDVATAVVVGIPDIYNNQGKLPCAIVLPNDASVDYKKLEEEIYLLCEQKLPEYSQLEMLEFTDKIPYTPIGKIDTFKLEKEMEEKIKIDTKTLKLK